MRRHLTDTHQEQLYQRDINSRHFGRYPKQKWHIIKEEQQKDVTILDVLGGAATVKLEMRDWVDYMYVGKINGKWLIINVLWEMKPSKDDKRN